MSICTVCTCEIANRLYEYGGTSAPMCVECFFALPDAPVLSAYYLEPIVVDGRQIGHITRLTEYGVIFFDGHGKVGDAAALVLYGKEL